MTNSTLKQEIGRKLIHLSSLLIVLMYWSFGKDFTISFLIIYLVIVLIIEYLRIDRNIRFPYLHSRLRKKEKGRYSGNLFFTIGAIVVISAFSKDVACAAILITTFADSAAAITGKIIGKHPINNHSKSLEGTVAAFIVSLLTTYILIENPLVVITMSLAATITELESINTDDNLMIPVISGFTGYIVLNFINIVSQFNLF